MKYKIRIVWYGNCVRVIPFTIIFFSELDLIQEVTQFSRKILPKFWSFLNEYVCMTPPVFDKNKMKELRGSRNIVILEET